MPTAIVHAIGAQHAFIHDLFAALERTVSERSDAIRLRSGLVLATPAEAMKIISQASSAIKNAQATMAAVARFAA
jgi:hypothetical protein